MTSKIEIHEHNWYDILGIRNDSTDEAIAKAARTMAFKYHPDKTSDPGAPEMYLLVQKAKEVLLDVEKRKEINEKFTNTMKRKEYDINRDRTMSERRKKFKEDLDMKVKSSQAQPPIQPQPGVSSTSTKSHTRNNVDEIRKESARRMEEASDYSRVTEDQRMREFMQHRKSMVDMNLDVNDGMKNDIKSNECQSQCQLKLKWKRSRFNHSDDSIYQLFKQFGSIEEVVLCEGSGNSAIITFSHKGAAMNAMDAYCTSSDYRLTMLENSKAKATIFTHVYSSTDNVKLKGVDIMFECEVKRALEREALLKFQDSSLGGAGIPGGVTTGAGNADGNNVVITTEALKLKEQDIFARMMQMQSAMKMKSSYNNADINDNITELNNSQI